MCRLAPEPFARNPTCLILVVGTVAVYLQPADVVAHHWRLIRRDCRLMSATNGVSRTMQPHVLHEETSSSTTRTR